MTSIRFMVASLNVKRLPDTGYFVKGIISLDLSLESTLTQKPGGPPRLPKDERHFTNPPLCTHSNTRKSTVFIGLLHGSLDTRGVGGSRLVPSLPSLAAATRWP